MRMQDMQFYVGILWELWVYYDGVGLLGYEKYIYNSLYDTVKIIKSQFCSNPKYKYFSNIITNNIIIDYKL